jgi:hypothetical protein
MPRRKPILWLTAETTGSLAIGVSDTVSVDFTNWTRPNVSYRLVRIRCAKLAATFASMVSDFTAGGVPIESPGEIMFGSDFGPEVMDVLLCPWTTRTLGCTVTNKGTGGAAIAVSFGIQEVDDGS